METATRLPRRTHLDRDHRLVYRLELRASEQHRRSHEVERLRQLHLLLQSSQPHQWGLRLQLQWERRLLWVHRSAHRHTILLQRHRLPSFRHVTHLRQ